MRALRIVIVERRRTCGPCLPEARKVVVSIEYDRRDAEKRRLLKVSINDAAKADALFTLLMGDEVPPRRQFIEDNALNVQFLDV